MVDRERDRGGWRLIFWIGDFLEISLLRKGGGEQDVVDDVESRRNLPRPFEPVETGVSDENQEQADIFDLQRQPLAPMGDHPANNGRDEHG